VFDAVAVDGFHARDGLGSNRLGFN
jgi:hypothetical protein